MFLFSRWQRKGSRGSLRTEYVAAGNRENATTSTLLLTPQPGDDGATFTCGVWNRALDGNTRLTTTININVDCKYRHSK